MSPNVTLEIEYLKTVNPILLTSGTHVIRSCIVKNTGKEAFRHLRLQVQGQWIQPYEERLEALPAEESVSLEKFDLRFDTRQTGNLNESVDSQFHISVSSDSAELFSADYPIRILPSDYWPGLSSFPESLACFVTPNSPGVAHVLQNAGRWMEKFTGEAALDGYQTHDVARARFQVAAIYEALREEGIVYIAPPASFEKEGQRVRMAEQVLHDKLGTCLDTTLLYASCLEQSGLHPLMVIVPGHAFVGCWLEDTHCLQVMGNDMTYLSKNVAKGISRLVVVETTAITSSQPTSFEEAVTLAEQRLVGEEVSYIDVCQCRAEGIRPIAGKNENLWQNAGLKHPSSEATPSAEVEKIDLPLTDSGPLTREQIWERKLLDISLRNNLINLKLGRRALPFFSFNIDKIEDYLQDGKDYSILPNPMEKHLEPNGQDFFDSRQYKGQYEQMILERIRNGGLTSYQSLSELTSSLKYIYRESRNSLEENGANSLFLGLGFLKWFESEKSVQPRYAPILLLPVDIIRRSNTKYVIRTREEDITLNTALCEMLKQNFRIQLPGLDPLPEDEKGCDVTKVLGIIRQVIMQQPRWDILEEAVLGLFSFSKFVMWNDVHNNIDLMRQNPVIKALLEKSSWTSNETTFDIGNYDKSCRPSDNAVPIDVDSSQLEAIMESGQGHSFILYGPPGTGKSQTITNMIANALFHGKRVLFVAEKKAALEVVQRRLEKIGLAPFCLELHSNKVTRTHFLTQLDEALSLTRIQEPADYQKTADELFSQRQSLRKFNDLMHSPSACGWSLYDCIVRYTSLSGEPLLPSDEFIAQFSEKALADASALVHQLARLAAIIGPPNRHPLAGLIVTSNTHQTQEALGRLLPQLSKSIESATGAVSALNKDLCLSLPMTEGSIEFAYHYYSLLKDWDVSYLFQDDNELRAEWEEANGKWFLPRYFARKRFLRKLQQFNAHVTLAEVDASLQRLADFRREAVDRHITLFQGEAIPVATNATECARHLLGLRQCHDTLGQLKEVASFDIDLPQVKERIPVWVKHLDSLRDWSLWCHLAGQARGQHLEILLDAYSQDACPDASEVTDRFKKGCCQKVAQSIIDRETDLQLFKGALFEEKIKKYKALDQRFKALTVSMLYYRLAAQIPSPATDVSDASELGILKRYIRSKGRGASIRKIIDQIPNLLPRLCPVMLMSPISVAQFIDLRQQKFDIVCFDEASQMPTSEAVGAIARGKALICVGDPKQMPPTSFFASTSVDEEDAENDDMESILDDCITISMPERYLNWHYRSRHESLIAFSNQQYYDGKLYTFPSANDRDRKVKFVHVDGTYDYGRTRCNEAEADAIVDEVVRRLKSDSTESLGIVAFSKVQQNLIEDKLGDRLAESPELEAKAYQCEEPVFIKNLENVQGDERDVILFSVGYGPGKNGKVSMNFGPLNNAGGERRLNVAVSRARSEMMVFTIMEPEMIDLSRTKAKGVEGLKNFLKFAKTGELPMRSGQFQSKEEDVAEDIAKELRQAGYQVDTHVGRSAFKMDLAVIHPKHPKEYILGILCDGETFSNTKTEREREIGQPSFLKHLGWNLMRVWTLDWYMDRAQVKAEILKRLSLLMDQPDTTSPAATKGKEANVLLKQAIKTSEAEKPEEAAATPAARPYSTYHYERQDNNVWNTDSLFEAATPLHLDRVFKDTIRTEQPITLSLLCKRVAGFFSINVVTKKFQATAHDFLHGQTVYEDQTDPEDPTYWMTADDKKKFNGFRENGNRKITEIPATEIGNAILYAIDQQIALPKADLIKATSVLLNFSHTGSLIQKTIGAVIDSMIASGLLQEKDNKIVKG